MRALYIRAIPRNPEQRQQERDSATIVGAKTFGWSALCALLQYGTYDAYFAPGLTNERKEELTADGMIRDSMKRLVPVPPGNKFLVEDCDELVLTTLGPELHTLATIRQKLRRDDAPLCGLIHSVNSAKIPFALLQQCFAGLCEADLLLCSSRAGLTTIDMFIEQIGRLLSPSTQYRARRVLVPLGVNIPTLCQEDRVTLRQRLKIGPQDVVVLFFGRLSSVSKSDLGPLLVALSILLRTGTNIHLLIAGDDTEINETPRLQALASELGCRAKLTIWPNPSAKDKHMLYSSADVFASLADNLQETYGLAVAEALAYGLPAVVSDWDGYRDLVIDGETGFLVRTFFPPNLDTLQLFDCPISMIEEDLLAQSTTVDIRAFCDRLQKLCDPALRAQMGRSARLLAEQRCSWQVIVKRYEQLWDEALRITRTAHREGSPTSPPICFPLAKGFGHFASAKRSPECKCFITTEGHEWLRRPARLYFLCHLYGPPAPQGFEEMLRTIAGYPGISVASVVALFSDSTNRRSTTNAHWTLGRLFKYGLVSCGADCVNCADAPEATKPRYTIHEEANRVVGEDISATEH